MDQFDKILTNHFRLTDRQLTLFRRYHDYLIKWNEKMNLTAIKDKIGVYHKHFVDSLMLSHFLGLNEQTLLDVGSGAGFPSIPLKILHPNLKVTIIDSLQKRITFLENLSEYLDLDIKLIHGRVEKHQNKNNYDIVTARAVARLNKLCELCLPFVRKNGRFYAYKGSRFQAELEESTKALETLNAKVENTFTYTVLEEKHTIIEISKHRSTDKKYPREFKKIKSNPL